MNRIRIVSVGKMKERYFLDAQAEYQKRLSRFARVEIVELADEPTPDHPTDAQRAAILKKEGQRIARAAAGYDLTIAMAIEAPPRDSIGFANALAPAFSEGRSLCFVIGGSLGIADEIKKNADLLLSLSPLTFPHRLARIVLLEQLFRSYKIINGETYHK